MIMRTLTMHLKQYPMAWLTGITTTVSLVLQHRIWEHGIRRSCVA
jgi:hypothetical protein